MKHRIRIIAFLLCFLSMFFSVVIINECNERNRPLGYGEYKHPKFKTKYTVEEHIQRITARTEERFQKDIENGFIVDIFVDIVYAFYDDDPEYFLVEIEYKEKLSIDEERRLAKYKDKFPYRLEQITDENGENGGEYVMGRYVFPERFIHVIGYIEDDCYKMGLQALGFGAGFFCGQSPYTGYGYKNEKKYYGGGVCGVKQGADILGIGWHGEPERRDVVWRVVSKENYKELMKRNPKLFTKLY